MHVLETNVRGTWVLLECARGSKYVTEVIVASSDKADGSQKQLPYTEVAPLVGNNPYDVWKSAGDLIATMFAKTYGFSVAIARCGNVYGGGDLNWSRIVPDGCLSLVTGKLLNVRSDGKAIRDYVYID